MLFYELVNNWEFSHKKDDVTLRQIEDREGGGSNDNLDDKKKRNMKLVSTLTTSLL